MTNKLWIKNIFVYIIFIIFSIGLFNFIIDPFHQYRVKTFYPISYVSKLERYINPGFAKNYDYDSVILGSSTSENFIISNVTKFLGFKKPIKLCISGTSAYEESLILETALRHKAIKNVLYGLDTFLFWGNPKRVRHGKETFPFYLYDNNLINDYQYIFSIDTTIKSIQILTSMWLDDFNSVKYNYNKMYSWQDTVPKNHFSIKHITKEWENRDKSDLTYQPNNTFSFYKKSFDFNFLKLIKKYPSTNFIIYFPPYSILEFKYEQESGLFLERLKFKKYIFEVTKKLPNVKIYDFQIAKEITHNLSNYHDLDHYHQKINKWILEQIKANHYLATPKNIDLYLKMLRQQVNSYKVTF